MFVFREAIVREAIEGVRTKMMIGRPCNSAIYCCAIVTGCCAVENPEDASVQLPGGYVLYHALAGIPVVGVAAAPTHKGVVHRVVDGRVTAIGWSDSIIVIRQVPILRREGVDGAGSEVGDDEGSARWWVIVPDTHEIAGPLSEAEYLTRKARGGNATPSLLTVERAFCRCGTMEDGP